MEDLYNVDCKYRFLMDNDRVKEESRPSYLRIFKITARFETARKKDLHQFSLEELEEVLYSFEASHRNTVEIYGRIISSYLNYCVRQKISETNPLSVLRVEDFSKYVIEHEKYLTKNELVKIEDSAANYQDSAIIRLLFVGVGGTKLSELRNLKRADIDFKTKLLHLQNTLTEAKDGTPLKCTSRYLEVDDDTLDILKKAAEETTYKKANKAMDKAGNIRAYTDLINNEYVLRASITKNDNWFRPVDKDVMYRRLKRLKEESGVSNLNSKFLQRSGQIYYGYQSLSGSSELSLDDIKVVAHRYNSKSYHNFKGFLSVSNIMRTYG